MYRQGAPQMRLDFIYFSNNLQITVNNSFKIEEGEEDD